MFSSLRFKKKQSGNSKPLNHGNRAHFAPQDVTGNSKDGSYNKLDVQIEVSAKEPIKNNSLKRKKLSFKPYEKKKQIIKVQDVEPSLNIQNHVDQGLHSLQANLQQYQQENECLRHQINCLQTEKHESSIREIAIQNKNLQQSQNDLVHLQNIIDALQREIETSKNLVSHLNGTFLQPDLVHSSSATAIYRSLIGEINKLEENLRTSKLANQKSLTALTNKEARYQKSIADYRKTNETLSVKIDELTKQVDCVRRNFEESDTKNRCLEADLAELRQTIAKMESEAIEQSCLQRSILKPNNMCKGNLNIDQIQGASLSLPSLRQWQSLSNKILSITSVENTTRCKLNTKSISSDCLHHKPVFDEGLEELVAETVERTRMKRTKNKEMKHEDLANKETIIKCSDANVKQHNPVAESLSEVGTWNGVNVKQHPLVVDNSKDEIIVDGIATTLTKDSSNKVKQEVPLVTCNIKHGLGIMPNGSKENMYNASPNGNQIQMASRFSFPVKVVTKESLETNNILHGQNASRNKVYREITGRPSNQASRASPKFTYGRGIDLEDSKGDRIERKRSVHRMTRQPSIHVGQNSFEMRLQKSTSNRIGASAYLEDSANLKNDIMVPRTSKPNATDFVDVITSSLVSDGLKEVGTETDERIRIERDLNTKQDLSSFLALQHSGDNLVPTPSKDPTNLKQHNLAQDTENAILTSTLINMSQHDQVAQHTKDILTRSLTDEVNINLVEPGTHHTKDEIVITSTQINLENTFSVNQHVPDVKEDVFKIPSQTVALQSYNDMFVIYRDFLFKQY